MLPVSHNPFKTPEFRTLFQEWNRILEKDGFRDAEDFTLPSPALKTWVGHKWDHMDGEQTEATRQYYEQADLVLNEFAFKTTIHRRIWELHCKGHSVRKISRAVGVGEMGKSTVNDIIQRIEKATGLKNG